MIDEIINQATEVAKELCEAANLQSGQTVVVGCSSSEVMGYALGSASSEEIGNAVFKALYSVFSSKGIYIAAQCCEHLNRALIIEHEATDSETVSVVPKLKAGGAFATCAYNTFKNPVVIEEIQADAGIDIGGTLIGMHLKKVAVPLRLRNHFIGKARVSAARTRPKFIGGCRAVYDEN